MMELSTYMAHFYNQMETKVDVEVALRQSLWLMDKYISWHGGHSFFKKMPNIIEALTKVRVGSNLEDDDVPES